MDWIRSSMDLLSSSTTASHEPHREPDVDVDGTPKFRIVDATNRVRELTASSSISISATSSSSSISSASAFPSSSGAGSLVDNSSFVMLPMSMSRPVAMTASHHQHYSHHPQQHPQQFNSRHHSQNQHHHHQDRDGDDDMLDDDAQLMQQLQFQREEMQFTRAQPLPRITPPPSHPFQSQSSLSTSNGSASNSQQQPPPSPFNTHAFTYSDSSSTAALHHQLHPLKAPPTTSAPPVSPFAGLALSAPAKTSTLGNAKPPVNPFSSASGSISSISSTANSMLNAPMLSTSTNIENSPRLPSLNEFRAGSPRNLKLGIASRPSSLSLRGNYSSNSNMNGGLPEPPTSASPSPYLGPMPSSLSTATLPSLSSSLPSPHHTLSSPYSHSLPGLSFLQERLPLKREQSFDGSDSVTNASYSSEDDERDSALLMMRLSSSVPTSGSLGSDAVGSMGSRSGRVCRFADCNNIARSRGLCRTHGGGKRCSHPGCDKSAQANRKCIAHGGGTPCSFDECEKTAQSRGLCKAHGGGARCKHPNCPKSSQSKGLCRGHGGGIKCKEDGCDKWVQKNGYCIKHGRERSMTQ